MRHPATLKPRGEAKDVLVLSRKVGERILIGDKISVTVVKIGHGGVRIGIEAPTELAVVREELAEELQASRASAGIGSRGVDGLSDTPLAGVLLLRLQLTSLFFRHVLGLLCFARCAA